MTHYDSFESAAIKKMIAYKEQNLQRTTGFTFQVIQREIMWLRNVLPIILRSTNIMHSEIANYAVKAFETALTYKCNDLVIGFHIEDNYSQNPSVGIAYPRLLDQFGTPGAMNIIIDVMDGNGVPAHPQNLPLNELM